MSNCQYCNRKMQPIKNDFIGRQYHKKCHFDKQMDEQISFASRTDYEDLQQKLRDFIKAECVPEKSRFERDMEAILISYND